MPLFLTLFLFFLASLWAPLQSKPFLTEHTKHPQEMLIKLDNALKKIMPEKIFEHIPKDEMIVTIPTLITLMRFALYPFIIASTKEGNDQRTTLLILLACISDFVDGKLARLLDQQTELGCILDALADKTLIASIIVSSFYTQSTLLRIPLWYIIFALCKEMVQATLVILTTLETHTTMPHLQIARITSLIKAVFYLMLRIADLVKKPIPAAVKYGYPTAAFLDVLVLAAYIRECLKMFEQEHQIPATDKTLMQAS